MAGELDLLGGLTKLPSLVPGRLLLFPFRLRLEEGRGGGPIGLSTGLKKLDLRRSLGVDGNDCKLSMVRSESDCLAARDLAPSSADKSTSSWASNGVSSYDADRSPWREADRKLSSELSWSLCSSVSPLTGLAETIEGRLSDFGREEMVPPVGGLTEAFLEPLDRLVRVVTGFEAGATSLPSI